MNALSTKSSLILSMTTLSSLLGVAMVLLASACSSEEPRASVGVQEHALETVAIRFGVYQTDKATELYRKFQPMLEMIEQAVALRLEQPVDIQLRIFKTYEAGLDALVGGDVDFVRFGPASYLLAHSREPNIELLAKESKNGKSTFHGVICVRADSPYETLEDLSGCRFAFGNPESTIGRYLSQAELMRIGITSDELESFEYLGQHDKVAKAVILGDFDAGALKESTFNKMNTSSELRALHMFENVTKPWVARADLDPEVAGALRFALLNAKDLDALKSLKVSGFMQATDSDYEPTRQAISVAITGFQSTPKPSR